MFCRKKLKFAGINFRLSVPMVVDEMDYDQVVSSHHEDLYRFAFSLGGTADRAGELTQETYSRLLTKGSQIQDRTKVKSWLFTTLYRIYLGWKRQEKRFPHLPLDSAEHELPPLSPTMVEEMDSQTVMAALLDVDEHYRTPLMLFYLQDLSYREVADLLEVPMGTVMSRLSRGKDQLRELLVLRVNNKNSTVIPLERTREGRET